ncbi:YihY/virulence factor BrkB family protein [Haloarcula sp. CBA1130]|uniref:YihY/virulence factor BrkB family protein n=1 Tax=unclassified Haloarcula TaxID=2624677 RepID=UPI0012477462|nr:MULTISPECIES: YihY/virulence factor BrkB family protein [unclassified Haloarcula]KAA9399354.1 YihY/virulence factor BrkB family protein [Haloarcula sp. CBA1129]KAA9403868.1 YihY/virulence factor BrkB family protein [Haloarcula sp. CBA1130]
MDRTRAVSVGRDVVRTVREEEVSFLAAGIAYYMFVSLLPLLLLTLVVGTLAGGEAFAERIVTAAGDVLSPTASTLLEDALTSGAGRGGATVLGIGVTLWSALKVFRGLDTAFSRVYGTDGPDSIIGELVDGLAALGGIGVALVGLGVVGALGTVLGVQVALGGLALVPVLAVAFLPLYYLFPDEEMTIRAAVPGAVFAGVGWTLLGTGFNVYAAQADSYQVYGVIGAVLLLVTWFYFAGQVLLVGAAVNAALADRQLQQVSRRRSGKAMSEDADETDTPPPAGADTPGPTTNDLTDEELRELREEFESFREDIEGRTLHRDEVRSDLKQYVRRRMRRGHARQWGPYIVLLYGTIMTLGAFYYLEGIWAVLAMLVVWLSTLGLYAIMIAVGVTLTATGLPGRLVDRVRDWRQ